MCNLPLCRRRIKNHEKIKKFKKSIPADAWFVKVQKMNSYR